MASNPRAMEDLMSILRSREPLYAKADVTLLTTGKSPEQSLAELADLIGHARAPLAPTLAAATSEPQ
jgi:XRE family aerobic/anaerobic benzoate catabolism transcriptional regulator